MGGRTLGVADPLRLLDENGNSESLQRAFAGLAAFGEPANVLLIGCAGMEECGRRQRQNPESPCKNDLRGG